MASRVREAPPTFSYNVTIVAGVGWEAQERGLDRSHVDLVYVAPSPVLSGLEGLDDRVLGGIEVASRVFAR
jgi:hypothetical protein